MIPMMTRGLFPSRVVKSILRYWCSKLAYALVLIKFYNQSMQINSQFSGDLRPWFPDSPVEVYDFYVYAPRD